MADLPDDIPRINALTTNARNTWFALLGVLVFVSITLMRVEHIDFYGVDRATQLPLVNVEVPTRYFFIAAPLLIAAIYGYFHLYLIRLWDELSTAADRQKGDRPLGDAITPWLVTDAALHLRQWLRQDNCTTPRTMEGPAVALNLILAWAFGIVILLLLWWFSMPARTLWLTAIAATCLLICLNVGLASLVMAWRRMESDISHTHSIWRSPITIGLLSFAIIGVSLLTVTRTTGVLVKNQNAIAALAPLQMIREEIVERPEGWLPYQIARKDFRGIWCQREGLKDCKDFKAREKEFTDEWQVRRNAAIADMRRPDWHKINRAKPDFRKASLFSVFLSGVSLRGAEMQGADLREAQLEGADLIGAQIQGANLLKAQMERADLSRAQMMGVELNEARMERATLRGAQMQKANLNAANMEGAIFIEAQMQEANLSGAQMKGAIFRGAHMQQAILKRAQMEAVDVRLAKMQGAVFNFSLLAGQRGNRIVAYQTNLSASINKGGALRFIDLQPAVTDDKTDFRYAFLDGTVTYSDDFAQRMGGDAPKPCQWIDARLTDAKFYSYWRWWVEKSPDPTPWEWIAPKEWRDVPLPTEKQLAIHKLDDCYWKRRPLPGAKW